MNLSASSSSRRRAITLVELPRLALAPLLLVLAGCSASSSSGDEAASTRQPGAASVTPPGDAAAAGIKALADRPVSEIAALVHGTTLKQIVFEDKDGQGLLLLSRTEVNADAGADEPSTSQIVLRAELFGLASQQATWISRWHVDEPTECEGLDFDAGYFLDQATVTDLDANGQAELTFASHSFCGGGVDPQQLHIEVRQGNEHYVVKGESLVEIEGDAPFGGERQDSASVARAPSPIQDHLDKVWEAIKRGVER